MDGRTTSGTYLGDWWNAQSTSLGVFDGRKQAEGGVNPEEGLERRVNFRTEQKDNQAIVCPRVLFGVQKMKATFI
jgi:hypothetical protein